MSEALVGDKRPFAVVLYYRNWPGVVETLQALTAQESDLAGVLVIDNNSGDGAWRGIKERFPSVQVQSLPENLGYAGAFNVARVDLEARGVSLGLFLTHDTVLGQHAVRHLVESLEEHPNCAVAGPLLGQREDRTRVFSAGGVLDLRKADARHRRTPGEVHEWVAEAPAAEGVAWVDGACMLVRLDALAGVGGLDERYFLYFEEVDLAVRLRSAGWKVLLNPSAVAWQSTGGMPLYFGARNGFAFFRTHGGLLPALRFGANQVLEAARDLRRGNVARVRERGRGLRDGVRGRMGPDRHVGDESGGLR